MKKDFLVEKSCRNAEIGILRENGAYGNISCKWKIIDNSGIGGKEYAESEGEITFEPGEVH